MIEGIIEELRGELYQADQAGEPEDWKIPIQKKVLRSIVEFYDREHSHLVATERLIDRASMALKSGNYEEFEALSTEINRDLGVQREREDHPTG